ncbi:competence/damage-inducible protein A [Christiangramia aquimixticola]|uniref:competence/damage-inducible protein A n=1 Tax=Christiangramia aquimixticola TaxID=1697558 RepID=UPI003AA8686E
MKAEIVVIGDEILIGQIMDTNSVFIAKELIKIGINVHQITTIQDDAAHILQTLKEARERVDVVIFTGGLGPTKDDITKKCLCEFFEDELVLNNEVLAHIEKLFEKYIDTPISQLNRDQALLPSKATALHNEYGTAAGMWFEENGKVVISLPGVPYEMKGLMEREVIPKLMREFSRPVIVHKTVITYGLGESALAEKIETWENNLPAVVKLAYLPSPGRVRLRLTAHGEDKEYLENLIDNQVTALHEFIGDIIAGFEDVDPTEVVIGRMLAENQWTLSTAESCTGGRLAFKFTYAPGSSASFKGSIVSYATESKIDILGVPENLIEEKSVVSAEVAKAMAEKARERFNTDFAISTTGNAGPTKGDSEADIGTVFIGIATPQGVEAHEFMFGNHREKVIGKSVNKSLELLQRALNDYKRGL